MPTFLRLALSLGFVFVLTGLAGCSSTPGGTSPQRPQLPASATTPTEDPLATLTLDADSAPLHAEPSASSPVVATMASGESLSLLYRATDWLKVRTASGVIGFVQPSALVASTCTTDRAEPRILEIPILDLGRDISPRGNVVVEAELDKDARILKTRVLENSTGDPALEQQAIADLHRVRFLPPTKNCKPLPFFYTFTREF